MTDTGSDEREHGWFIIDNELIDDYQLSPHTGWLYCAIVRHINKTSGVAFPSIATLAKKCCMGKSTVSKHLDILETKKLISRQHRTKDDGSYESTVYRLLPVVKAGVSHQIDKGMPANGEGVSHQIETKDTNVKETKEKDIPDKPEGGFSSGVNNSGHAVNNCEHGNPLHSVMSKDGTMHKVCQCERNGLISTTPATIAKLERGTVSLTELENTCPDCNELRHDGTCLCDQPLVTGDGINSAIISSNVESDRNIELIYSESGAVCGAMVQMEQPANIGNVSVKVEPKIKGVTINMDGTKTYHYENQPRKDNRVVTREDAPIAQTNTANIKAEVVETSQAVQEAAPAKKTDAKKKPKHSKEQRKAMTDAVLDAVGWQESDVNHWGRINKVVTTLLNKGATIELLAEWRDWNAKLECGRVQNPEGITGNGWPKFMKHKREQETKRTARPQHREIRIHVDEEYQ